MNALFTVDKQLTLTASLAQLEPLGQAIDDTLRQADDLPDAAATRYAIVLAIHELVTNIITHAYDGNDAGQITIVLSMKRGGFKAEIADFGKPFFRSRVADPDLDNGQEGGYGIFLIEQIMDDFNYHRSEDQNHWVLVKRW